MPISSLRDGDPDVPPVVCVHPVAGHTNDYRALAAELAWRGPILGIDAPAHDGDDASYELGRLAARYRDELGARRGVCLLGWAVGGVIAAELARALVAADRAPAFLGVLDSRAPVPEMRKRPSDRDSIARFFVAARAMARDRRPPALASSDAATVLATLRAEGLAEGFADAAELERQLAVFIALSRAFMQHELGTLPVTVHLFESADAHPAHPKPPTLGWENHAQHLEKRVVPGTHFTLLRDPVAPLARAIEACLPAS